MLFFGIWMLVPLLTFKFVFKSPGTHILHYYIPLYALAAFGLSELHNMQKNRELKNLMVVMFMIVLIGQIAINTYIFVPQFRSNYPFKSAQLLGFNLPKATKTYQLFLYGFNYNRNWTEIGHTLKDQGARSFYTNDNKVVATYYVKNLNFTEPGTNYFPPFVVLVPDSSELRTLPEYFIANYNEVGQVATHDTDPVRIYRLKQ
jgi:hypothetical protein